MCKAKKNISQSQAIEHLSNWVKPLRSDKLEGVQVELIQSFNESIYETLNCVIQVHFYNG